MKIKLRAFKAFLLLSIAAVMAAAPSSGPDGPTQDANTKMSLAWDTADPLSDLTGFRVYLSQSNTVIRTIPVQATTTMAIELTNVLFQLPNGVYELQVTAIGKSALESDQSQPLWIFWYGQKPGAPTNLLVSFTKP